MTPKEKADQLLEKMNVIHHLKGNGLPVSMHNSQIKKCALIAVDEIINEYKKYLQSALTFELGLKFWQQVKQEIKNL